MRRELEHGNSFLSRLIDKLVVHIRDIYHPGHVVARVLKISLDRVEDYGPDHVADVGFRVNRRPAQVHAYLAWLDGLESLFSFRQRIVDANRCSHCPYSKSQMSPLLKNEF